MPRFPSKYDSSDDDDSETTVACPYCARQVYEDAPQCPGCGRYISDEDAPPPRKPWWIILGAIACIYAVCRWVLP